MFKKSSIRFLVIILAVLLLVLIIQQLTDSRSRDRNFAGQVMDIDTSKVSQIVFENKTGTARKTVVTKTGGSWKVTRDGVEYRADRQAVRNILTELTGLKPERMAATGKDKWVEYELADNMGLHITLKSPRKTLAGIVIGKFSYHQPTNPYDRQGKLISYVRRADNDEVFAVNGFLRMTLSDDLSTLRDKYLIRQSVYDNFTTLTFTYPGDSSFILTRQGNRWLADGIMTDSASVVRYLDNITPLNSSYFADIPPGSNTHSHMLSVEGTNLPSRIEIMAFPADSANQYLITSSQNPGTVFSGREKNLFSTIFRSKSSFIAGQKN